MHYPTNPTRETKREKKIKKQKEFLNKKKVKEKFRKEKEREEKKLDEEYTFKKRQKNFEEEMNQEGKRERRKKEVINQSFDTNILNYFKIMEIPPTKDFKIIKKRYHELSKIYHPDKGGNQEKFKILLNAYQELEDKYKI